MAKAKTKETEMQPEVTVEYLMSLGASEEEAKMLVGANQSGGSGLPFPALKVNYEFDAVDVCQFGSWMVNAQKEEGVLTSADVITNGIKEKMNMVILASKFQYSKYDAVSGSTSVSSNIFSSLGEAKAARDAKSGRPISELKKKDDKIKMQEIALVKVWSDTAKPVIAIAYIKGALLYGINQMRNGLPNNGNLMYEFSFNLEKKKNGSTNFVVVDEDSVVVNQRSMEDIKDNMKETSEAIKAFTSWVDTTNQSNTGVATTGSGGTAGSTGSQEVIDDADDDDLDF